MKVNTLIISLLIGIVFLFVLDVCLGTVFIKPHQVWDSFFSEKALQDQPTITYIVTNIRAPRAVMAIIAGAFLAISGILMQTLFRNPLAGPFVLGISSGAGLGVAFTVLGASWLGFQAASQSSLVLSSILGSVVVLILILLISFRLRDTMGLLIIGLMVGSLSSAIVGILSYFSASTELQRYVFWSLGSLSNVSWFSILILASILLIGMVVITYLIKSLNALLLGEQYALSLGINIRLTKWIIIILTSVLAGSITAYAGPIAFIGLAVPHLTRMMLPSVNHKSLFPTAVLLGAALLLFCDIIAQLPFSSKSLPINAVTSLIGAPVVIWLIVRKRKLHF